MWRWGRQISWEFSYGQLVTYIEHHKRLPVRYDDTLKIWCMSQRYLYDIGKMSNIRMQQLNKLGEIWYWNYTEGGKWDDAYG